MGHDPAAAGGPVTAPGRIWPARLLTSACGLLLPPGGWALATIMPHPVLWVVCAVLPCYPLGALLITVPWVDKARQHAVYRAELWTAVKVAESVRGPLSRADVHALKPDARTRARARQPSLEDV
jgi:hypothetical protein